MRPETGRAGGLTAPVARRTARAALRSGVLWGYVFGVTVGSTALTYVSTYRTAAERAHLAALFRTDTGLAALNGPAAALQTVAGFTAWKTSMVLAVVGAAWGLLTAGRLLRGEEDAGRWELLLAGRTGRAAATAQALAGLGAGLAALWAVTAAVTVATGQLSKVHIAPGRCLLFALAVAAAPAMFLAVGALTSQLAGSRRRASATAGVVLGASYALRLVADSGSGLAWLRWCSPIGWVENLQPLTAPRPVALVPVAALTALAAGAAVLLAGRRDLGAGLVGHRQAAPAPPWTVSGPTGLTVRLAGPGAAGWAAAVGAIALLFGCVARQGGEALADASSFAPVAGRLGVAARPTEEYLGVAFLLVAVLVALAGVAHVAAARAEEADGHLEHLLVRQVDRVRWLLVRAAVGAATVVAVAVLAGLCAWMGAAADHVAVGPARLVAAGANVAAPGLCLLGVGMLIVGWRPRAALGAAYGLVTWSFLVEIAAGVSRSDHWVLDTSLFHQMAAAPAVAPDWVSAGVLVALGVAGVALGAVGVRHRDVAGA